LALAVVGALALAACGSKSSSNGSGGNGVGGGFAAIVARTGSAKYKVTYQQGNEKPFTIAQNPPRFSFITDGSATYVTADGSAVSCSGTAKSATCTSKSGGGALIKQGLTRVLGTLGALFVSEAGKGIPGLGNIKSTDKSIAGRAAACATIDASTLGALGAALGSGSYSACVDKQSGVMLESTADDGNGHVTDIKATAYGSPTEADLTPPSKPIVSPGFTVPST
jgi:hypothetical protein